MRKMLLMIPISESLHHLVDEGRGILLTGLGQVQVDHGGFKTAVAEVTLDGADIDARFQEVCGIGVPERMHAGFSGADLSGEPCAAEGALHRAFSHGMVSRACGLRITPHRRKDKSRVAMGGPVFAQDLEGSLRQGDETIFGAFTAVDVEHHAMTVDVSDFEMLGFLQPQTAGVDGGERARAREGPAWRAEDAKA